MTDTGPRRLCVTCCAALAVAGGVKCQNCQPVPHKHAGHDLAQRIANDPAANVSEAP
jgi:hypothetical protein